MITSGRDPFFKEEKLLSLSDDPCLVWVPSLRDGKDEAWAGFVRVVRHSNLNRLLPKNHMWISLANESPWGRILKTFTAFNTITVRDGIKVNDAHQALLQIREYRLQISPDMQGALR